jgi:hypothetical protein
LLFDRPLGRRPGLEAAVRDRLTALHREAVGALGQAGLGALHGGQLLAQILHPPSVELVLVEVLGVLVAGLALVVGVQRTVVLQRRQRLLDAGPLGGEQVPCAIRFDPSTLLDSWPEDRLCAS